MPGKQNVDIRKVIACIQELKNLVSTLPAVNQKNPLDQLNYYSILYIIAMVGELAGLARRLDSSLENDPILKKLVENRNKLFHNKVGKSSWVSPDVVLMSQDIPTVAQLDEMLLIFTGAQPAASSGANDRKIEIPSTKKRDLVAQKQQEPVVDEITCMRIFWQTVTACEMLLQYSGSLLQNILIHAAQMGSYMHLANFFVEGLGETNIVIFQIDPNGYLHMPEEAEILLTDGHKHHGNLTHSLTSPMKWVESSKAIIRNGAHQLYLWYQSSLWLNQFYANIAPFDVSSYRKARLKEAVIFLNSQRTEITDIAISILEGELSAIQQAREKVQSLSSQTENNEQKLLIFSQLLKYEKESDTPNPVKIVLLQQEIAKLGELPQVSQEQAQLDSEEPATKKVKRLEESTSQEPSAADLDSHSLMAGDDLVLEQAKKESLFTAQQQGNIGPRFIQGWELHDVEDKGNCFYDAVVHQMKLINHDFLRHVPEGTLPRDDLRLHIQEEFKDGEWAEQQEIENFIRKFNAVIAIVDTRDKSHRFLYHYIDAYDKYAHTPDRRFLPLGQPIIKLAYTGNHYMSVVSHSQLDLQQAYTPEKERQQEQSSIGILSDLEKRKAQLSISDTLASTDEEKFLPVVFVSESSPKSISGFQGRLSSLSVAFSSGGDDVELRQLPPPMTTHADDIAGTSPKLTDMVAKEPPKPKDKDNPNSPKPPSPTQQ